MTTDPDRLHRTRPDQYPRGRRGGGEQAAGDEHDETCEEEPLAPPPVREIPGGEQEGGE